MQTNDIPLIEYQRQFLAGSTMGMPIAGLIIWLGLAVVALLMGEGFAPIIVVYAAAAPFPLSFLIDKLRGATPLRMGKSNNPLDALFLKFISVVGVLVVLLIFATRGTGDVAMFVAGMSILSGLIWVPYGFAAGDPVGFRQFTMRAVLAIAAYMFAPDEFKIATIALGTALAYAYALIAMKRPESARSGSSVAKAAQVPAV